MIQLYKALVMPHLEYASTIWQVGNCDPLEKVQIMLKDSSQLIKMTWDRWRESEKRETRLSPFGKMNIHLADMTSNTDIKLHIKLGKRIYIYRVLTA